ncbi:amidohydrolase/deacetylase family metallohydrolase [Gracilibacillus sp. HCP3S3_G5_1]|uniref:amidohydrolase/deacetylase family metallohydrolase n=1 Tax=unclassified Gracilibacillus TaxID=2625209 RepID=UPI003F8A0E65
MADSYVLQNVQFVSRQRVDIVIKKDRIAEITEPGKGIAQKKFDYSGCYVSSGWIDLHVHANKAFYPYGDVIDEIGIKQGVTTIVDAGSCGADNIQDLLHEQKRYKTNVYAFLNISSIGLTRTDELSNLKWLEEQKVVDAVTLYQGKIIGLKARISKSVVKNNDIVPLQMAKQFSRLTSLPLMVHIGSGPPNISEILRLLNKKDIVTHFLHGKSNNLFPNGKPLPDLLHAIQRGVLLDVGHGSASFSFQVAESAKKHHTYPFSISTDIYRENRVNGPVYSLANVASKFLYLGYSLEQVIDAITVQPAKVIGKPYLAKIDTGNIADLTLFTVLNKECVLVDSIGEQRVTNQLIEPKGVVKDGELITY